MYGTPDPEPKCPGFNSPFNLNFSIAAESCGKLLQRGETPLARGETEGLCLGGVPAHPRQVHQHVRRTGRAQEHEELREE